MNPPRLSLSLLSLALLAAFVPAQAEGVAEGSVSIGAGAVSGSRDDRSIAGQYLGIKPGSDFYGLFGAEYYRRDDEAGTSLQFQASDLFNGNRELGLRWKKQGDWKFSAEFRELTRYDTGVANTGLPNAGSTTPQTTVVAPGAGGDLDLKTKRTGLGFEYSKIISSRLQLDASVKSENKEGARLSGIGFNCPSPVAPGCRGTTGTEVGYAVLFAPEPIKSNHSQLEARVSYAGESLRLSGGYYGSIYRNDYGSMTVGVPGHLDNMVGTLLPLSTGLQGILSQPVALPPDNQAHQLDLTGTYGFSRTTLLNFKVAYTEATQTQNFASAGLTGAPAGVTDLGGKVTTTMAQVGITARPMPKLNLSGSLHYEDRNDHTPLALYNVEGTAAPYTNRQLSRTEERAKAQAAYQFTSDWRGTLGVDYQAIDRGGFTPTAAVAGITALRQKTDETTVRAEMRRRMTEDLSGAVTLESSQRHGSTWLINNSGTGVTPVTDPVAAGLPYLNGIFMPTLADRTREKVKFSADWQANEKLSLQAVAEVGTDRYHTPSDYGLRRSGLSSLSLDGNYALNDKWNLTGFLSYGRQELDQSRPDAAVMAFRDTSSTFGIGTTGKLTGAIDVGANLAYMNDRSVYAQTLVPSANGELVALLNATGGLPDTLFRQTSLKLFGKYTIDKQSNLRLDVVYQSIRWSDWAWGYNGTSFVYSDGTTINRKWNQGVGFIGVSYVRRWP